MRLGSLCFLAFLWPSAAAADLTLPRLSVDAVDILWAYIGEGPNNATTIRKHMDDACSRGFTYLRFAASGFAAQDMTMCVQRPNRPPVLARLPSNVVRVPYFFALFVCLPQSFLF